MTTAKLTEKDIFFAAEPNEYPKHVFYIHADNTKVHVYEDVDEGKSGLDIMLEKEGEKLVHFCTRKGKDKGILKVTIGDSSKSYDMNAEDIKDINKICEAISEKSSVLRGKGLSLSDKPALVKALNKYVPENMDQMVECLTQIRTGKKTTETKELSHSEKISKLRGSGLALADKIDEDGKEPSLLRGKGLDIAEKNPSQLRGKGLALADKTDEDGKKSSLLRGMMLKQIKEIGGK